MRNTLLQISFKDYINFIGIQQNEEPDVTKPTGALMA